MFACFFLTGLIWNIQITHYPAFAYVSEARFAEFHRRHSNHITWVVGPVMALELGSAGVLLWQAPGWLWGANLLSVALTWALTFFVSVPIHEALGRGENNARNLQALVRTNWARTATWTLRSFLLAHLLLTHLLPMKA